MGVYREHTPEAALLVARSDHPRTFRRSAVIAFDLSAWLRLTSYEAMQCAYTVMHMDDTTTRGAWDLATLPRNPLSA